MLIPTRYHYGDCISKNPHAYGIKGAYGQNFKFCNRSGVDCTLIDQWVSHFNNNCSFIRLKQHFLS